MAGPTVSSGQQVAYLKLFVMPYLLKFLFRTTYLMDSRLRKMMYGAFIQGSSWHWLHQGRQTHSIPKRLHGKKKPSMQFRTDLSNGKLGLQTYLSPIAVSIFRVGCCIKGRVREILASCYLRELPSITRPIYTNSRLLALQGSMTEPS
jgi:hypothetical protein